MICTFHCIILMFLIIDTVPDDIQDYIFSNLRRTACDLVKDSKYGMCSCDSPVVRKMIGERMESITMMHTM